tara:strand:+ start:1339 stop:1521 length:183 start_codon:yes stop_codon:yes gene_type:complete
MDCFFSVCANDPEDCEYKFIPTNDIIVIIDDNFNNNFDIKPHFDSKRLTVNSFPQRSTKY